MAGAKDPALLALVYDYLLPIDQNLAQIFQKKTKAPVLSKGASSLVDVFQGFQSLTKKKINVKIGAAHKSESDSSSESEDEAKPPQINGKTPKKLVEPPGKTVVPAKGKTNNKAPPAQSNKPLAIKKAETSSEESSSDEDAAPKSKLPVKAIAKQTAAKPTPAKAMPKKEDSSSEESDSEDEKPAVAKTPQQKPKPAVAKTPQQKPKPASPGKTPFPKKAESSSEESSDEEESKPTQKPSVKTPAKVQPAKAPVSDSESSDSDSDEEPKKKLAVQPVSKKPPMPATPKPVVKTPAKKDSSSEDSSSEDEPPKVQTKAAMVKGKVATPAAKKDDSSSDSSDSDVPPKAAAKPPASAKKPSSSEEDSSDEETPAVKPATKLGQKQATPKLVQKKAESSDSESDSSEDEEPAKKPAAPVPLKKKAESSSEDSSSEDEKPAAPQAQKRKREDDSEGTPAKKNDNKYQNFVKGSESFNGDNMEEPAEKKRKLSEPFRRVKSDEIEVDPRLADNSFEAKKGARGCWGEKAAKDLKFTRGKSFRHEKTKKKRGSYRGGQIDIGVNSIKFED